MHIDSMITGEENSEKTMATLAAKERTTKTVMCCVAPRKSSRERLTKRVMLLMREFGCELEKMT